MLSVNGLLLKVDRLNVGRIVSRIQMAVTTTVSEIDLKTTCRICLLKHEPDKLFSLFGSNQMFNDLSLASAISDCFGINLKHDKELPNCVCIKCASTTLQAYTFKKCLEKCQGFLEKQKAAVTSEHKEVAESEKENVMRESQGILYNYLVQDRTTDEKQEKSVDSTTVSSSSLTKVPSKPNKRGNMASAEYVAFDHNYCKELKPETSAVNNENLVDNSTGNTQEQRVISKINKRKKLKLKIKNEVKKSQKLPVNKSADKTADSDRWWMKQFGPPYSCRICGRNYDVRYRPFYMHVRMHRLKRLPCIYCGKRFIRDRLVLHMRTHTNEKPYACNLCSARFTLECNLKRHVRRHTGEKPFVCSTCGKSFTQSTSLLNHMQMHTGERRLICECCGKTFVSDGSYRSHFYKEHGTKPIPVKEEQEDELESYCCDICGRVFSKSMALQIHRRSHENKYSCSLCTKRFTSYTNYRIHTLRHQLQSETSTEQEVVELKCEFCSEIFTKNCDLAAHLRIHVEKAFLCSRCGQGFMSKMALQLHVYKHTDERPFSCKECSKTFRSTSTLRQHSKVHTGEKPHMCEVCLRRFTQQQQLLSHLLTHTGEKKYVCPFCGKAFALNGNLTVHKRRHTGETPYICDVCGKGFYDSSSRKKHRETHAKKSCESENLYGNEK